MEAGFLARQLFTLVGSLDDHITLPFSERKHDVPY